MVQVPLPRLGLQVPGTNGLSAGRVVPAGDAAGFQIARLGQALQRTGLNITSAARELEETRDLAAHKESQARAEQVIVEETATFKNTLGKAATGEDAQVARERLQARLDAIENGIEGENRKGLFQLYRNRRMPGVRADWGQHEAKQTRAYELGEQRSLIDRVEESARRQDPEELKRQQTAAREAREQREALQESGFGAFSGLRDALRAGFGEQLPPEPLDLVENVRREATAYYTKLGMSEAEVENNVRQHVTRVHQGRVQDKVDAGRSTAANDYISENEDDIDAAALSQMRRLVRGGVAKEEGVSVAQEVADGLQQEHRQRLSDPNRTAVLPPVVSSEHMMSQGIARITRLHRQGRIELEVRNSAYSELQRLAGERQLQEVEAKNQVAREGESWLLENPTAPVRAMPESLLQRGEAFNLVGNWLRFSRSGNRYDTDVEWFRTLLRPDGGGWFAQPFEVFESEAAVRLDRNDYEQAIALWRTARGVGKFKEFSIETPLDRFKRWAENNDIEDDDQWQRARKAFEAKVNVRGGREAASRTPSILDDVLGELELQKVWLDRFFGDEERVVATLSEEELEESYVEVGNQSIQVRDIPLWYRNFVTAKWRQEGRGVPGPRDWAAEFFAYQAAKTAEENRPPGLDPRVPPDFTGRLPEEQPPPERRR